MNDIYTSRLTTIRIPGLSRAMVLYLTPCNRERLDGHRRPGEETDKIATDGINVGGGGCQVGDG